MLRAMKITMTMKTTAFSLAVAATSLSAGVAHAGITIVAQRGEGDTTTMYVDGDHGRFEMSKPDKHDTGMIFDGASKKFLIVNDRDKSYSEITEEDMKKMSERVAAMRAQAAERMKSLPPEQRKKMEAMMGSMGGMGPGKQPDYKFERIGDKKTVNGFACETYRMLEDGKAVEELCISPWSAGLVKKGDFEGLRKFAEGMAESFKGAMSQDRNWFMMKKFESFPGFPITRTLLGEGGKRTEVEQVKSVKRGSIAGSMFSVPAGYTKKPSPFEQMGGMGGPGMGGPGHHPHGGPGPKP
jgi:hypothetical protein